MMRRVHAAEPSVRCPKAVKTQDSKSRTSSRTTLQQDELRRPYQQPTCNGSSQRHRRRRSTEHGARSTEHPQEAGVLKKKKKKKFFTKKVCTRTSGVQILSLANRVFPPSLPARQKPTSGLCNLRSPPVCPNKPTSHQTRQRKQQGRKGRPEPEGEWF